MITLILTCISIEELETDKQRKWDQQSMRRTSSYETNRWDLDGESWVEQSQSGTSTN